MLSNRLGIHNTTALAITKEGVCMWQVDIAGVARGEYHCCKTSFVAELLAKFLLK